MTRLLIIAALASIVLGGSALAQGTQDYTGARLPRYQSQGQLPTNTTAPTPNRQSNIFSAGTPPIRVWPIYRRTGTQRF